METVTRILLLAIFMICSFTSKGQNTSYGMKSMNDLTTGNSSTPLGVSETDTIKVVMLVSDTAKYFTGGSLIIDKVTWITGYEVRNKYCCANGNTSELAYYSPVPYYTHNHYLDDKKQKLKSNIVVWMSRSN